MIFGFVGGDYARQYNAMSPAARKSAVLNQFVTFFGSQARNAIDFFETSWSGEQWTRGCPVGIPSQGTLLAYGPQIRQPVGRIHWAGTETSTYWNGYMDGAVRLGRARRGRSAVRAVGSRRDRARGGFPQACPQSEKRRSSCCARTG